MRFKNIYKYVLAFGVLASVGSCTEDNLDLLPKIDEVYEGKIFSLDELQQMLNNSYGSISSGSAYGADAIVFGELMSDNAFLSIQHDGYYVSVNQMNFTDASSDAGTAWLQNYRIIRDANLIIHSDTELLATDPAIMEIRAQAHIMKGLAYFTLAQYFSPSPALGMDSPYGIVLKPNAWDPGELTQRSSLKDTYAEIVKELELGLANAPDNSEQKIRLTKTVAKFLLAKVHLHFGNNEKAIAFANEVINNSPAEYDFIDPADLVDYFTASKNVEFQEGKPETIWEIPQTDIHNLQVNGHPGVFFANNGQHRSIMYRPSFKDTFVGDIRFPIFGVLGSEMDIPRGLFIRKWQRANSEGPFTQNIKVFRMTEAKFIKWEAMAKMGQGSTVLTELNEFAMTRNSNTYSGDALTAVLEEKRREFFGEGHRYHDLKRNALAIVKETNCTANCNIEATDKLFVFPIPFGERQKNPEIEQYPGY